jgi:DNA polymerase-3 subunit alpha
VDKAAELGQTAICFSEHGNVYNWIDKKMYCKSKGIKYMHGIEIYLTESLENKVRDNYHTILIAKNYEGVKEINTLIDSSTTPDHFYYKPRITFDEFLNISDNVIKISACLASPLSKVDETNQYFDRLCRKYDYFELQYHNETQQKEYNLKLVDLSHKYNKPVIAGTDTHSLNKYKAECRSLLQKAKKIQYSNEDSFDMTYKSYEELIESFRIQGVLPKAVILEAIQNTNIMADSVEEFELDTAFKYPKLYENEEVVLKKLINEKYKEKLHKGIITKNPRYKENIKEEFRVFKKIGMVGFMLFMSELMTWCRENKIPFGNCRGSVGGSTIAYIIDIIDLDPIVWNTVFSRFANEDRLEIGDIDVDISPSQRELVYNYIINRFGFDKTAYILAIGTVSDKGTIDEIGRALHYKWLEEHPNDPDEESPYHIKHIEKIKQEHEKNPEETKEKYPDIFYYFDGMLNTTISQSMHPSGIIASPITLPDNYCTFWSEGKRIISVNMEEVHEVSLVKYDILGLKNIQIIKDTCELIGIDYPLSHEINWNDEKVWNDIITSPVGVFQFEGSYAYELLKRYEPQRINDLSLVNASLRPSGASYRDRLIAKEFNQNPSIQIDDLLKDNNGFLVFQEDTIKFLQNICGLSGSEADNIRRAIGRKQKERLDKALPQILEGYCNKSDKPREIAEQEAKAFLQIIEDSSNYQFGYNHSTGYSMIGYLCGYFRYYYPIEFITAYLNNANNEDDINAGTELAKLKGMKIEPIKFRYSKATYFPDKANNVIYKGLSSVKFFSDEIANQLYYLKDKQYDSFVDFLKDSPCDSRQTDILIKLDFFSEFGKAKKLSYIYKYFQLLYGKKQIKKANLDKYSLKEDVFRKYARETEKSFLDLDSEALLHEICERLSDADYKVKEKLKYQLDFIGHISYINPEYVGYYLVLNVDTKYSPKADLYKIETGEQSVMKLYKNQYFENEFDKGDILIIQNTEKKPKSKMIDGKWVKSLEEFDTWIRSYTIQK